MSNDPVNYEEKIKDLEKRIAEYQYVEREKEMALEALQLLEGMDSVDDVINSIIPWMKKWSGCEAVGIRLRDGEDFPYYTTSGFSDQFVRLEKYLCRYDDNGHIQRDEDDKPLLECMCGNILQGIYDPSKNFFTTDGCFWSNATTKLLAETTDRERLARTRNRCNSFGYESVALIPLRTAGETFGLLQFNDYREGRFTRELIAVYRSVADHIASYLTKLKANEKLKRSEEHLKAVFNNSADAVGVSEMGTHQFVNPAYFEMFRYKNPEELIGKPVLDLISEKERDRVKKIIASRDTNDPFDKRYQTKGLRKDGTEFDMEVNVAKYETDSRSKYIVILRDITNRIESEKRLKRQKIFLKKAQDIGKIGTWELDVKNNILKWTEENYRIFGIPIGTNLTYETFINCVHPRTENS